MLLSVKFTSTHLEGFSEDFVAREFSEPTGREFEHPALGIVVDSGLGRSIPGAAADLGRSIQVAPADHLDVEHLNAVRTGRLSDLIGRLLELDGGSW